MCLYTQQTPDDEEGLRHPLRHLLAVDAPRLALRHRGAPSCLSLNHRRNSISPPATPQEPREQPALTNSTPRLHNPACPRNRPRPTTCPSRTGSSRCSTRATARRERCSSARTPTRSFCGSSRPVPRRWSGLCSTRRRWSCVRGKLRCPTGMCGGCWPSAATRWTWRTGTR